MIQFRNFSKKQKLLLTWWHDRAYINFNGIICDGAVRSGKTSCMALSFIFWAIANFNREAFAICGRTILSVKRNVIYPLIAKLNVLGFICRIFESKNYMDVKLGNRFDRFYFFGGRDESSASLIQGITLSGVMLDEVVLMPRSFVEQAVARCSKISAKFWFNCNPDSPFHWFYNEWIKKSQQKQMLYLHFCMKDNPGISAEVAERYRTLYDGVFYDRFIKGIWRANRGQVYPMFSEEKHVVTTLPDHFTCYYVSFDYGIVNPTSFGLWGENNGVWYRIREYYYDSKIYGVHCTDEEFYTAVKNFLGGIYIEAIVIDPSAASFIECVLRKKEFKVIRAKNNVISGINLVSKALNSGKILFSSDCKNSIREFYMYEWDEGCDKDSVKKENDHAMDEIRYFVSTIVDNVEDNFFVLSVKR